MSAGYHADVKVAGLLQQYLNKIRNINIVTEVGFFEGATYPDGTSVAYVAYLNEYGQHNPPRPFLKRTMEKRLNAWTGLIQSVLKRNGLSRTSVHDAYNQVGIVAVGDVKKTIKDWNPNDPRPNKPATIKAKMRKSANAGGKNQVRNDPYRVLHDTGVMINSVVYKVRD